jgi:hypothetical protein
VEIKQFWTEDWLGSGWGRSVTIMGLVEFDFGRALNAEQTLSFFNHASPHHQGEKANGS